MRRAMIVAAVTGGLWLAPASLTAQENGIARPSHEFGVDLSGMYTNMGSPCAENCGALTIATPVDLRIGFLMEGPWSVEPRLGLLYQASTSGEGHVLQFTPGINVLYAFGARSGPNGVIGPYLTAGAALEVADLGDFGGSATQVAVNLGLGQRMAWGSAAFRPEAFVRYRFRNAYDGVPSYFDLGVRIGVSLFR
jgi:hypothetical protein